MAEMVEAGLVLTLVGMTVVFALLGLLVGAVELLARFCRLFPAAFAPERTPADAVSPAPEEAHAELAGVIAAAVRMFRRDHPPPNRAARAS